MPDVTTTLFKISGLTQPRNYLRFTADILTTMLRHWFCSLCFLNLFTAGKSRHTHSNWLQRDVATQSVATCMEVSCTQLQSVADILHCQIFPATICCVASHCRAYAGELQVQEPMQTFFTSIIILQMRACRLCSKSSQCDCAPVADTWDWNCDGAWQSVATCMPGLTLFQYRSIFCNRLCFFY